MFDMYSTLDLTDGRYASFERMQLIQEQLDYYGWSTREKSLSYKIYVDGSSRTITYSCNEKELCILHNQEFIDIRKLRVDELMDKLLCLYPMDGKKEEKVKITIIAVPESGLEQTERYIMCGTQDFMKKEVL